MPVEVVGYVVGNLGEDIVTGLRDGRVEGVRPSLPKNIPVQTSHEQPLHVVVVLVVVSGSIREGGAPHDAESQRHVSAVVYLEIV